MPTSLLLEPIKIGEMHLKNRIVMAPLTRMRANENNVALPIMAAHFAARADAGLLITDATQVAPEGRGYSNTPGIKRGEQLMGWKRVTHEVHRKGGRIFLQLWHVGRYSHPFFQPERKLPLAPSAIAPEREILTPDGYQKVPVPKEMDDTDIRRTIEQFRQAAVNAMVAGFDGIEIHGANGYLIDQFLQDGSNQRTDAYGGSIEKRARFLFELLDALVKVWGENKVGLRLSPSGRTISMSDSNPQKHFSWLIGKLNAYPLAYLHLIEPFEAVDHLPGYASNVAAFYRPFYDGLLIANNGFDPFSAAKAIADNETDMVAFGRYFISNPDLVERIKNNQGLRAWDDRYFYSGGTKGYLD